MTRQQKISNFLKNDLIIYLKLQTLILIISNKVRNMNQSVKYLNKPSDNETKTYFYSYSKNWR